MSLLVFAGALAVLAALAAIPPGVRAEDGWKQISSLHADIMFHDQSHLAAFERKLQFNPTLFGLSSRFDIAASDDTETKASKKVDALFERVQDLLDMRRNMDKVIIRIHKDSVEIQSAFKQFNPRSDHPVPRSWYTYEQRTVFVNLQDIREGILAHEMAHHVIDHYLQVRPAAGSAEMLAIFAEKHLFD